MNEDSFALSSDDEEVQVAEGEEKTEIPQDSKVVSEVVESASSKKEASTKKKKRRRKRRRVKKGKSKKKRVKNEKGDEGDRKEDEEEGEYEDLLKNVEEEEEESESNDGEGYVENQVEVLINKKGQGNETKDNGTTEKETSNVENSSSQSEEEEEGEKQKKKRRKKKKRRRKKRKTRKRRNSDSGTFRKGRGAMIKFSGVFNDTDEEGNTSPTPTARASFGDFLKATHSPIKKLKDLAARRRKSFQETSSSNIDHKKDHSDDHMQEYDKTFKIVVIGESGVGKSALIGRYVRDEFVINTSPTVGVEFCTKAVQFNECIVQGVFWDTAGQEKYMSILPIYYRGSRAAILVYDIAQKESFLKLSKWVKELKSYVNENVVIMVIGNKTDLRTNLDDKGIVTTEEGVEFCKEHNFYFMETSAKTSENVEKAFGELLRKVHDIDELKDRISSPICAETTNRMLVGESESVDLTDTTKTPPEEEEVVGGCAC